MDIARAIVAAILATGLVVIAIIQELGDADLKNDSTGKVDMTMLLLAVAVIILIIPDTINYFRSKKNKED